jgi:hypothetical protein
MMLKTAIIKGWYSGTYTADVQVQGSLGAWLKSVKVSRAIAGADMVVGHLCLVATPTSDPNDAVLIAVWA